MRFAFVLLVPRLCLYACFACDRVFGCRCVLQGCVSDYTRVDCMCVFGVSLVHLFVLLCLFSVSLRMSLPLYVARLRFILHVCVDCICVMCSLLGCLLVCVCMLVLRVVA